MTKSRGILLSFTFIIVILLSACVPDQVIHDAEDTIQNGGAYEKDIKAEHSELSEQGEEELNEEKLEKKLKVLSVYKLEAESVNLKEDLDDIIKEVHDFGGYVASNVVRGKEVDSPSSSAKSELSLRVPKDKVNETIKVIKDITSVQSESVNSVDITDKYYDVEARIKGLEIREERLRELYKSTDSIKDIIEIDNKLAEVEEAKEEEVRGKFKMDKRISFSRIDVNLKEVKKVSEVNGNNNMSSGEKITEAISFAKTTVKNIVVGTLSILIKSTPVMLLIAGGIYMYIKHIHPRLRARIDNDEEKDNS